MTVLKHEDDTDLDIREAWDASRHDEDCNKFTKTSVSTFISVAFKAKAKTGRDGDGASKYNFEICGLAGRLPCVAG